ncbi:hypothetical protein TNIN_21721 [Trichonephila inaurata madagascariensis]|uniref:Uncharacterized protein n=1 Tax=Trichonephila inaurata madagascariensis TaxID=2747483 RepID=A0A8X6YGS9_9ARAC|nr:hypothetical protein TNIN_21721 [Trichonephila inaurata madagascariensis]
MVSTPKNGRSTLLKVFRMSSMVFCTLGMCCYSLGVARGNSCEMCDNIALFLGTMHWTQTDGTRIWHLKNNLEPFLSINTLPTPLEPIESDGETA